MRPRAEGGTGSLAATCFCGPRGPQRPSPIWSLHTRVSHLFTPPTDMFAGAALRHSKKLYGSGVGSSGSVSGSDPQMSTSCNFLSLTEEEKTHQHKTKPHQHKNETTSAKYVTVSIRQSLFGLLCWFRCVGVCFFLFCMGTKNTRGRHVRIDMSRAT